MCRIMADTSVETKKFKDLLNAKQMKLISGLRNRDGIVIEKAADALDEVQLAGERELAIRVLDREAHLLRSVRSALRRIDERCYGTCLHCAVEIGPKRLAAVPWTAYCIDCQQIADQNKFGAVEAPDVSE